MGCGCNQQYKSKRSATNVASPLSPPVARSSVSGQTANARVVRSAPVPQRSVAMPAPVT